jgi:hypothetical protein
MPKGRTSTSVHNSIYLPKTGAINRDTCTYAIDVHSFAPVPPQSHYLPVCHWNLGMPLASSRTGIRRSVAHTYSSGYTQIVIWEWHGNKAAIFKRTHVFSYYNGCVKNTSIQDNDTPVLKTRTHWLYYSPIPR